MLSAGRELVKRINEIRDRWGSPALDGTVISVSLSNKMCHCHPESDGRIVLTNISDKW